MRRVGGMSLARSQKAAVRKKKCPRHSVTNRRLSLVDYGAAGFAKNSPDIYRGNLLGMCLKAVFKCVLSII